MDPIQLYGNNDSQTIQSQNKSHIGAAVNNTNGSSRNDVATAATSVTLTNKNSDGTTKRKITKNRSMQNNHVIDKNLDEWLDNCMKDNTYMTSSSEFLDSNFPIPNSFSNSNKHNSQYTMRPNASLNCGGSGTDLNGYQKYFPSSYQYPSQFGTNYMNGQTLQHNTNSGFTSLPPVVNLTTHPSEPKSGSQDLLDTFENRRNFSDPCLAANSDNDSKDSGDKNSQQMNQNNNSTKNDSNLVATLLQQMNILHETNSKIIRNLQDTKLDIENLKHAPNWGLRHRRDSISGLSTHSQPMGYAFGTHSPAPTYHSGAGMYTPGMLTDVVREVKEAARVREEALISRVKALVEERSWTINDTNIKLIRDMEEMKIQINQLKTERNDNNLRLTKMEEEIKSLRILLSHVLNTSTRSNTSFNPPHNSSTNREFSSRQSNRSASSEINRQKRTSLNLNYGGIDETNDYPVEMLMHVNHAQYNDLRKSEQGPQYSQHNGRPFANATENQQTNGNCLGNRTIDSNSSHLYANVHSDNEQQNDDHIVQMEKEALELRRELQETIANQKRAEKKAQALENLVKNLQSNKSQPLHITEPLINHSSRNSSVSEGGNSIQSQGKPQIATQIQTISPKLLSSNISLSGPVTDL